MTNPVPLGAPDYARLSPFSDEVFVNTTGGPVTGATTLFQQYVGNIRALWLSVLFLGTDGHIALTWYQDRNFTLQLGSQILDVSAGTSIQHTMRPFAPYLVVAINSNSGAAYSYSAGASSIPDTPIPWTTSGSNEIIKNTGFVVPATSAQLFTGQPSWIGHLYWNAFCTGSNWTAELQRQNRAGPPVTVDMVDDTCVKGMMRVVPFTGGCPQVTITNNSAAPVTARVFVLGDSAY